MKFELRPYQKSAVDAATSHVRTCKDPAVIVAGCGSGKSIMIAEIAKFIHDLSGKRILCLAPSRELVIQNRKKYLATGNPASMFSASAGNKCMKHAVIFGSPITVLNSIDKFKHNFAAIILDECHMVTKSIKKIIDEMRKGNPMLRVIGTTATPFRTGTGYIYQLDEDGKPIGDDRAITPYFKKKLYEISEYELMDMGFLTPLVTQSSNISYDTSTLEMKGGKFTSESVEQVFNEDQRLTHDIIEQVKSMAANRGGVMIFASTVQHAKECMNSLPTDNSAMVTGATKIKEREKSLQDVHDGKIKYLVSVGALTTGVDLPIVDTLAILRATESQSLILQIFGRGTRLFDGKHDCLVLDYAANIDRHGLEGNLFAPEIQVNIRTSEKHRVSAKCECCGFDNDFGGRKNPDNFAIDEHGYFIDLMGNQIIDDDSKKPYPAHYGRRCEFQELKGGDFTRCIGRWSSKLCPHEGCGQENDIAARYCSLCKGEIVDPNNALKIEFKKIKKSPYEPTSDKVLNWFANHHKTKTDKIKLKINWTTEFRTFDAYYDPAQQWAWVPLCMAVFGQVVNNIDEFVEFMRRGMGTMPATITSSKNKNARFVNIKAYNQPEDLEA